MRKISLNKKHFQTNKTNPTAISNQFQLHNNQSTKHHLNLTAVSLMMKQSMSCEGKSQRHKPKRIGVYKRRPPAIFDLADFSESDECASCARQNGMVELSVLGGV
jgi:hypothetical protein